MAGRATTGVYLVQGGEMARLEDRGGRLAFAAVRLHQDRSHLTADDADRRLAEYQEGMDDAAARKRDSGRDPGIDRAMKSLAEGRRELLAAQAALAMEREDLRRDARIALDTEARGRRLMLRSWRWLVVGASLSLVGAVWTMAALIESRSLPLAALIAACAFTVLLLEIEHAGRREGG
jgi:hypothetical protein